MSTLTAEQTKNDKRLAEIHSLSKNWKCGHKHCPRCTQCLTNGGHICIHWGEFKSITKKFKHIKRRKP